ncbi:MAG: glycoside hydrolase family 15 protein [Deltaproteobacteria bacterium]
MELQDLGLIGNCQCSALVARDGSVRWCCLPRLDSEPLFAALLDEGRGGRFTVGPADGRLGTQRYLPNTNVLETTFETDDGALRVIDFFPRFVQHERTFRPTQLVRIVEPISGTPRIRAHCDPILGWSQDLPHRQLGSHHVSYLGYGGEVRLTTDVPLSYLTTDSFALTGRRHFVFSFGQPVEEPLAPLCERFLANTVRYWQGWVKHCDVPPLYQHEVIRSALALKLHCFEDTGAIRASTTTTLPEAPGSSRTWDYRYCWLRDAYYTLGAFRLLGHFEEREQFLGFLVDVASRSPGLDLQPLYRIDGRTNLEERVLEGWAGYHGERPVRVGNQAAEHRQHDVFGEMVLALLPLFVDERIADQVTPAVLDLVERLADKAIEVAGQPDAGIWEYRAAWRPQTFSTLMCWAAADRAHRICAKHRPARSEGFAKDATRLRELILKEAVDPQRLCLVADHGGSAQDAALLQAVTLRLLPPDDPRMIGTVDAVRRELEVDGWLRRYSKPDDFGVPEVAFTLCTYWFVEALAVTGRRDEAREVVERTRHVNAPLGLLAEDVDPRTGRMWGNFPQAYSHAGVIHAAFAASPSWSELG